MASITLSHPIKKIQASITLTGSKSESNRALILQALSKGLVSVENLSQAADTQTLLHILNTQLGTQNPQHIDVGPAGTAMRFLTALLATQPGEYTLTGSQRMKDRPIGILVNALQKLGAHINYIEQDGYPPLSIKGPFEQKETKINIQGNVSSQYISALLLIAPSLPKGLCLELEGELTSKPYVEMTLAMLQQVGIQHSWEGNQICIEQQAFKTSKLLVEPDWSAASYWYAIAALAQESSLNMPHLQAYSLQGDSKITELMANFGITSQFKNGELQLTKESKTPERKIFDLKDCPDLAQTLIVCCAALGHEATFTGLETLKIKETDRVKALQTELAKIGVTLIEKNLTYKLDCSKRVLPKKIQIATYEDHRMAMAFTPLALLIDEVEIMEPQVVAKSYPHFWDDLKTAGFEIKM
ncbi:MAG: 3-phosphoshikimate 1-carboxyvinyltransferase [Sphingobacteriaceae bacterium]|nr:3-phosphoshikimate 1-carboxyvinyltransferase [Sphingobacteriaceae bacterium]